MNNRRWFYAIPLLSILLLSACNTQSSGSPDDADGKKVDKAPHYKTLKELEESGLVPVLDRTDSLAGIDQNQDGIRDDIEKYINGLNLVDVQTNSLRFIAYVLQNIMLMDLSDTSALEKQSKQIARAVNCAYVSFPKSGEASRYIKIIQAQTANTKERVTKYISYNTKRSGSVLTLPSGDTCEKH